MQHLAVAGIAGAWKGVRNKGPVPPVTVVGEWRTLHGAGHAHDGDHRLRVLGERSQELEDVDGALGISDQHDLFARLEFDGAQRVGDLLRIVGRAGASAHQDGCDPGALGSEPCDRLFKGYRRGGAAVGECAAYDEDAQPCGEDRQFRRIARRRRLVQQAPDQVVTICCGGRRPRLAADEIAVDLSVTGATVELRRWRAAGIRGRRGAKFAR